jgi:pimeloyl-ACP methyl ester carboxylesterase
LNLPAHIEDSQFDLRLTSGNIHMRRVGPANGRLILWVHGLSAHMHAFDHMIQKLAAPGVQLVALDLRGRGRSQITASGSYGLDAHARDILEVADLLGAEQFDLVGWSMGALIGICVANLAPKRLRKLAMLDHAGQMDLAAIEKIQNGLGRLDVIAVQPADYVAAVRIASGITPWTPFWEHYYHYELGPYEDETHRPGYKPTTDKSACAEDLADAMRIDWPSRWPALTMPTLLLRCLIPIGGGFIVPEAVRNALHDIVPHTKIVEVNTDHYLLMTDDIASDAIEKFLG